MMKIYTVFSKGHIKDYFNEVIYVEEGFSFLATFLGVFWTLYHRLWLQALLIFLIYSLLITTLITDVISEDIFVAAFVSFSLYIGLAAKDWYEKGLLNSGYLLNDIIIAKNIEEAQYKFISRDILQENQVTALASS
jgi:hypothetical protein